MADKKKFSKEGGAVEDLLQSRISNLWSLELK
jgi:hypothetical protein